MLRFTATPADPHNESLCIRAHFDAWWGIFRELREDEEQIQKGFGDELEWEELPGKRATRIATYRRGSIDEDSKSLTEIKDWSIEKLIRLKKVFDGRIKKVQGVKNELRQGYLLQPI